jgi:hypothetical protein
MAQPEQPEEPEYREFTVNVAGITKRNKDGTSREEIALTCHYGQRVLLVREPDNRYDPNAVMILTEDGRQLGYVDAWNAKDLQATLKGTSRVFSHADAWIDEFGYFEKGRKELPYMKILIRRYYRKKPASQ